MGQGTKDELTLQNKTQESAKCFLEFLTKYYAVYMESETLWGLEGRKQKLKNIMVLEEYNKISTIWSP